MLSLKALLLYHYFILSVTLVVSELPVSWSTAAPRDLRVAGRVQVLVLETIL